MQRRPMQSRKNPLNPPSIRSSTEVMPLTRRSGIGIPSRMRISLVLKHLVQLPQRPAEVSDIPSAKRQHRPAPIPIGKHGRIPDNDDLRLRSLLVDPIQHSAHLRRGGIDPLSQLIVPPSGHPIPARRRGPMRCRTGRSERQEPDVVTPDTEGNQRRLRGHGVQLRRVGTVPRLLRPSQVSGRRTTAADVVELGRLQVRRDEAGVVVVGPVAAGRSPDVLPGARRGRVGVTESDVATGAVPGGRARRRCGRRTVVPLVVPERQKPDHDHHDEAAAPAVLRHTFVSTEPGLAGT